MMKKNNNKNNIKKCSSYLKQMILGYYKFKKNSKKEKKFVNFIQKN